MNAENCKHYFGVYSFYCIIIKYSLTLPYLQCIMRWFKNLFSLCFPIFLSLTTLLSLPLFLPLLSLLIFVLFVVVFLCAESQPSQRGSPGVLQPWPASLHTALNNWRFQRSHTA